MAQLNITLNQDEILQLLSADREDAFRTLLPGYADSVLKAESQGGDSKRRRMSAQEAVQTRETVSEPEIRKARIGTITLNVPRHRNQPFHTMIFENYSRGEAALVTTMAEMVVKRCIHQESCKGRRNALRFIDF